MTKVWIMQNTHSRNFLLEYDLKSLGLDPKRINRLNDDKELEDLADNIKQTMYEDYKLAYSKIGGEYKDETLACVST